MAENPLLPNKKLQELYSLLGHCAALDKPARRGAASKPKQTLAGREALLAAVSIHLEAGDRLSVPFGDVAAATLTPEPLRSIAASTGVWPLPANAPRLFLQAAAAATLKASGDRVSVSLLETPRVEPGWVEALTWAQHELLPMVFVCLDRSGKDAMLPTRRRPAARITTTWSAVDTLTRRLGLPTIVVDGQDAVAVYRAMQESVLRGRMGAGPALIWAILPTPSEPVRPSARPLARLSKYLSVRNIALPPKG